MVLVYNKIHEFKYSWSYNDFEGIKLKLIRTMDCMFAPADSTCLPATAKTILKVLLPHLLQFNYIGIILCIL